MTKSILFICDNINECTNDFKYLEMLYFSIDDVSNYQDILPKLRSNKYYYIVIDLEFCNKTGDNICIYIRKNITKPPPILGIYGFHKLSIYKFKYNIWGFNNISTKPILNWKLFLLEARNQHLLEQETREFNQYIKKEITISNHLYKTYFGRNPKRIKL